MILRPEIPEHSQHAVAEPAPASQVRDPVCGMSVDPNTTRYRVERSGSTTTYFCSENCQKRFLADPDRYLKPLAPVVVSSPPPHSSDTPGIIYTCPMHTQILRNAPGNWPICGMTLEPLVAAQDSGTSPELRDMTRRFWIGAALAFPMLILEMAAHVSGMGLHRYVSPSA